MRDGRISTRDSGAASDHEPRRAWCLSLTLTPRHWCGICYRPSNVQVPRARCSPDLRVDTRRVHSSLRGPYPRAPHLRSVPRRQCTSDGSDIPGYSRRRAILSPACGAGRQRQSSRTPHMFGLCFCRPATDAFPGGRHRHPILGAALGNRSATAPSPASLAHSDSC